MLREQPECHCTLLIDFLFLKPIFFFFQGLRRISNIIPWAGLELGLSFPGRHSVLVMCIVTAERDKLTVDLEGCLI